MHCPRGGNRVPPPAARQTSRTASASACGARPAPRDQRAPTLRPDSKPVPLPFLYRHAAMLGPAAFSMANWCCPAGRMAAPCTVSLGDDLALSGRRTPEQCFVRRRFGFSLVFRTNNPLFTSPAGNQSKSRTESPRRPRPRASRSICRSRKRGVDLCRSVGCAYAMILCRLRFIGSTAIRRRDNRPPPSPNFVQTEGGGLGTEDPRLPPEIRG